MRVDWYHASEHVWTVAKALHGDDTPETKAWAKAGLDCLWHLGPKPLLNWFDATQPGTAAAASVLKGSAATSAPIRRACTTRPFASSSCRLAPAPSKPRPNNWCSSA